MHSYSFTKWLRLGSHNKCNSLLQFTFTECRIHQCSPVRSRSVGCEAVGCQFARCTASEEATRANSADMFLSRIISRVAMRALSNSPSATPIGTFPHTELGSFWTTERKRESATTINIILLKYSYLWDGQLSLQYDSTFPLQNQLRVLFGFREEGYCTALFSGC